MFHITLDNCAFIHLVNVFFCTESCSSVEDKEEGLLQKVVDGQMVKQKYIGHGRKAQSVL